MRKTILLCGMLISAFFFFGNNKLYAQTDTEFWFVKPNITSEHTNESFKIVITTREFAADVTIEMPAEPAFSQVSFSVPAYTSYAYTVIQPSPLFTLMENKTLLDELSLPVINRDNIGNKAILLKSTAPINAYLTQIADNNTDIYALKGSNGIGTEFIIPFQEHGFNQHPLYNERAFSSVEIIGIEDATVVEITPPLGRAVYRNGTFPSQLLPYSITLNRGEVYSCPPAWDPTVIRNNTPNAGWWGVNGNKHLGGIIVKVISGKGVAVIKKDDSVCKYSTGGWDEIGDQWVPYKGIIGENNDILGNEYVAMRGGLNNGWEYVYVAAPENNTRIWWGAVDTISSLPNTILNRGQQVGIPFNYGVFTNNFMEIISNKPLSVLHISGVGTEMGGAVLPPIDKCNGSTSVSFTRDMPWAVYINIMVRAGAEDNFLVDGVVRNDIIDPAAFHPVGSSGDWVATQIYYASGDLSDFPVGVVRTISNNEDVFHLGLINGSPSGGCKFGYFSDFNEIRVDALFIQNYNSPSSTIRACIGDSVQLYASGGQEFHWWPSSNLSNTDIASPKVLIEGFRVYFVEVSGVCNIKDTATVLIEAIEVPEANFTPDAIIGCNPLTVNFDDQSSENFNLYKWVFDDGTVLNTVGDISHTFTHSNTADTLNYNVELQLTSPYLCRDTARTTISVFPYLEGEFTIDDSYGCSPLPVKITNNSAGEDHIMLNYGDGTSVLNTPTFSSVIHTYRNSTNVIQNYTITLTSTNDEGCIKIWSDTVIVYPEINANFAPDLLVGCNPLTVNFTDNSTGNLDKYKWILGDGNTLTTSGDFSHTFSHSNTADTVNYNVELQLTSPYFCRDTARATISVFPYLEGEFTIDGSYGCSPLPVTITNNSAGEDIIMLDYGDGTPVLNTPTFDSVIHTYRNTTNVVQNYTITLTSTNNEGCTKIWNDTVIVYPEVQVNYTIDGNSYTGCNERDVLFTNTSNYGTHTASTFLWTFGDDSTSNTTNVNVPKTYTNSTNTDKVYIFNLKAQSQYGCWDDTSHTITIYRAFADFVVDTTIGCSPLPVTIINTSIGNNITTWAWNFGDATSSVIQNPPVKTYTNITGTTLIRNMQLTVTGTSGCSASKTIPISIYSSIDVTFTPITQVGCDSLIIPFNSSILPNIAGTTYSWDFRDGTFSDFEDPSKIYRNLQSASDIIYNPKLKVETPNGCKDSVSTTVVVHPYVNAFFSIDNVSGCTPLSIDAIATQYTGIPTTNYIWSFGDTYNYNGYNPPAHTYPANPAPDPDDTYTLRLTVSDPSGLCTDYMEKTITVYAAAKANFTPREVIGCNPFTVDFANSSSSNSSTFLWDFGDGTTTNILNPASKIFDNKTNITKQYYTQLTATTTNGCTHDTSTNIFVYPYVNADFNVDEVEGCSPVNITITNNSSGGTYQWYWNSQTAVGASDYTSVNSSESFSHVYTNTTGSDITYYLTVVVQNANGCSDTLTREILVHSSITADFTFNQPNQCNESDVVFTNTSIGGGSYNLNWNFGDGTTSNEIAPVHSFSNLSRTNDILYSVLLTATSESNCSDTASASIIVYHQPLAIIAADQTSSCEQLVVNMNNLDSQGYDSFQWIFGDGTPNNTINTILTHSYTNPLIDVIQNYNLKLMVETNEGCTHSDSLVLNVFPSVVADFTYDTAGCSPFVSSFTNTSTSSSDLFNWSFGDGNISSLENPFNYFINIGSTDATYFVTLIASSEYNCVDTVTKPVIVHAQPIVEFDAISGVCTGISNGWIEANSEDTSLTYLWSTGETTNRIDNLLPGYYSVTATNSDGCSVNKAFELTEIIPYEGQELCIVGVDSESGKNLIYWQKENEESISDFIIYKLDESKESYIALDTINIGESDIFIDQSSEPQNGPSQYKISIIDSCGNESSLSSYHQSIYLISTISAENVKLIWTPYNIENSVTSIENYLILRSSDSIRFDTINVVTGNILNYTDNDAEALSGDKFYKIAGLKFNTNYQNYDISFSNVVSNSIQTGFDDFENKSFQVNFYPNPFKDEFAIQYILTKKASVKIEIFDILGNKTATFLNDIKPDGVYQFDINATSYGLNDGVYYLKFTIDNQSKTYKIIRIK